MIFSILDQGSPPRTWGWVLSPIITTRYLSLCVVYSLSETWFLPTHYTLVNHRHTCGGGQVCGGGQTHGGVLLCVEGGGQTRGGGQVHMAVFGTVEQRQGECCLQVSLIQLLIRRLPVGETAETRGYHTEHRGRLGYSRLTTTSSSQLITNQ